MNICLLVFANMSYIIYVTFLDLLKKCKKPKKVRKEPYILRVSGETQKTILNNLEILEPNFIKKEKKQYRPKTRKSEREGKTSRDYLRETFDEEKGVVDYNVRPPLLRNRKQIQSERKVKEDALKKLNGTRITNFYTYKRKKVEKKKSSKKFSKSAPKL